jgi:Cys-tRNA(Pro)/Cys-tRNA(Cys) deacylase
MAKKKKGMPKTLPMRILEEKGIPYEAHQQARKQLTAEGVAEDLGVPVAQVVKAMIVELSGNQFALMVVPGDQQLSLKKASAVLQDKQVALAQARDVERVTGYQVGAVSVLGFRRTDLPVYLDEQVLHLDQTIISAGRPDIGLALTPADLARALEGALVGDYCQEG